MERFRSLPIAPFLLSHRAMDDSLERTFRAGLGSLALVPLKPPPVPDLIPSPVQETSEAF